MFVDTGTTGTLHNGHAPCAAGPKHVLRINDVTGFELHLPEDPGITLAHAEDTPDPGLPSGHLLTCYHDDGLILVKLDEYLSRK